MLKRPSIKDFLKNSFNGLKGYKLRLFLGNIIPLFILFMVLVALHDISSLTLVNDNIDKYIDMTNKTYRDEIQNDVENIVTFIDYESTSNISNTINDSVQSIKVYIDRFIKNKDTNKAYWITDTKGNIIVNPMADDLAFDMLSDEDIKEYSDAINKVVNSKDGYGFANFSYTLNKKTYKKVIFMHYYKAMNWVVTASFDKDVLDKDAVAYKNKLYKAVAASNMRSFIIGIIVLIIVSGATGYMGISTCMWIREINDITDTMKTGVLTKRLKYDFKHELKETSLSINSLQDNFVTLISKIANTAKTLNDAVKSFSENHIRMNSSIDSVSNSIYEITENINNQAMATSNVSSSIDDISDSIKNTSNEIKVLNSNSESMQMVSDKSMTSLNKLLSINERTKHDIEEMYEQTKNTNDSVEKISIAAELINQIATQTNLLSLNASIEAARAGENGKGFAVVATEIGNLATQSSATVKEINALLEELTTNSSKSIDIVKEMTNNSSIQNTTLLETNELFNSLSERLNVCIKSINSIFSHIEVVNEKRDNIILNLTRLNDISTSNAASTEETAAMSEELTDMVNKSSNNIQELAKEFDVLNASINEFTFE